MKKNHDGVDLIAPVGVVQILVSASTGESKKRYRSYLVNKNDDGPETFPELQRFFLLVQKCD